jgi:hypothetical protein
MNTQKIDFPRVNFNHRFTHTEERLTEIFLLNALDQMLRRASGIVGLLQTFHESDEGANEEAFGASTAAAMELMDCRAVLDVFFEIRKTQNISDLTEAKE